MLKKSTLLLLSVSLLFIGCGDTEISNPIEEKKKSIKEELIEHKQPTEPQDLLKKLGFDLTNEKIIIDINKTTSFFENIEKEIEKESQNIEAKIKKHELDFSKDLGIEISQDKIGIDLNKTRNMFQQMNSLVKDIILENNVTLH